MHLKMFFYNESTKFISRKRKLVDIQAVFTAFDLRAAFHAFCEKFAPFSEMEHKKKNCSLRHIKFKVVMRIKRTPVINFFDKTVRHITCIEIVITIKGGIYGRVFSREILWIRKNRPVVLFPITGLVMMIPIILIK